MAIKGIELTRIMKVPESTARKWLLVCLIGLWSLATFFYLNRLYNPSVIFMEMTHILPGSEVEAVIKGAGIEDITLRYEKPMGEGRLIMTTGGDGIMEQIAMVEGYLLMPGEKNMAVIGDQVAVQSFNSLQALWKEINLGGHWYRVAGVMDDSSDIMVSYGGERVDEGWHKMTVLYLPPEGNRQNVVIRDVERALALNGLHYHHKLHYRDWMNFHLNLAVISALYMLFQWIFWLYHYFHRRTVAVVRRWRLIRNTTQGHRFIASEKSLHALVAKLVFAIASVSLTGFGLMKQLRLPDGFLPDNLFSPNSWWVKLGSLWDKGDSIIENGITGIYKTSLMSWLMLFAITTVLLVRWSIGKEEVKPSDISRKEMGTSEQ